MIKKTLLNLVILLLALSLSFPVLAQFAQAKADMVVVQSDGEVVLITNEDVLAATTKPPANPPPNPPKPPFPTKTVQLAPSNTPTVIQTNPSKNNTKKLDVTVRQTLITSANPLFPSASPKNSTPPVVGGSSAPTGSSGLKLSPTPSGSKPSASPTASNSPSASVSPSSTPSTSGGFNAAPESPGVNKQVDEVILQGKSSEPILTLKPAQQQNQITISQGGTEVTTSLSLQINNQTHSINSVSPSGISRINVLPKEAVDGAVEQGYIKPTTTQGNNKVTLTQEGNNAYYQIQGEKEGKILGFIPIKSTVEVKMSAETGKVVKVSQSPIFNLLGFLLR